jgi:hypothetical protein
MVEHAHQLCVNPDKQVTLIDENLQEDGTIRSVSGTWGAEKRRGLTELYARIAEGNVKLVLCFQEDRLFRDETGIEYNNYIRILKQYNVYTKCYATGRIYNFEIPWDVKEFRSRCESASDELTTKIKLRMQGAREYMVARGEYATGSMAVGFVRCEAKTSPYYRKPIPYDPHAEVVRWIFQRYYEVGDLYQFYHEEVENKDIFPPLPDNHPRYYSLRSINSRSQESGIISLRGLRYVLSNPMYIGYWFDPLNGRWLKNNHPAIVDEAQFWYAF